MTIAGGGSAKRARDNDKTDDKVQDTIAAVAKHTDSSKQQRLASEQTSFTESSHNGHAQPVVVEKERGCLVRVRSQDA